MRPEVHDDEQANRDSFFCTNMTREMDELVQSQQNEIWRYLENALFEGVQFNLLQVSVIGDPVCGNAENAAARSNSEK